MVNQELKLDTSIEGLKQSQIFKDWVKDEVVLIQNLYADEIYPTYLVIVKNKAGYDIYRFFLVGNSWNISCEGGALKPEEIFKKIFIEYSNRLN